MNASDQPVLENMNLSQIEEVNENSRLTISDPTQTRSRNIELN